MDTELNKDFYNDLPSMVCMQLDDTWIPRFGERDWFHKAWEEYRQHIKTASMDDMMMPFAYFKKYLTEEDLASK